MKILIDTIKTENAELYSIENGKRYLYAKPVAKIEHYEEQTKMALLGSLSCKVRKRRITLAVLGVHATIEKLEKITRFELIADIQRPDGVYQRIRFDKLIPVDLDLDGEWTFETELPEEWRGLWKNKD
ncbi:MAG: hypothetical protein Q4A29_03850 [Eubacteriales bacterium]|nr:hypothetical protein [Eubacteriales bacterium]